MARIFKPVIVTANDLRDGRVVWRDAAGGWTRDLAQAALFDTQEGAEAALAAAQGDGHLVVGAEFAPAAPGETGPRPTHMREGFRAAGPSNYPHGEKVPA